MRILVDTNIILDQLLDNPGFAEKSEQVIARVDTGEHEGFICATTATNIFYILRKHCGREIAVRHIKTILSIFKVASVNDKVLSRATDNGINDFEDAVLYESALSVAANIIVTRNTKDFANAKIIIMNPEQFLATPRDN